MYRLFTSFVIFFSSSCLMSGQTVTTSQPLNKNAILEEYTGIHCQYCPQGHVISAAILANNPGRSAVIAIHQGGYASPGSGEPDYRTPFGDALAGQTGLTGYPSGTVNRHIFSGSTTALNRGDWTADAGIIMQQPSPVNIGVESTLDTISRLLTVHVELFYTGNSANPTNYIHVALIQNHVFGPQTGGGAGNNYEHMEMLRYLVTGQWGDPVSPATTGTLINRTYTYTIPAAYNNVPCVLHNCEIVAYVSENHQEILTGDVVPAIDGTNQYIGDLSTTGPTMKLSQPGVAADFNLLANSNIAGQQPFQIKITSDAPSMWMPYVTVDGNPVYDSAVTTLEKGVPKPVVLTVIPGAAAAFTGITLELSAVNKPNAPHRFFKYYVISGVNTLLVNAAGDNYATQFQDVYINGLTAAGCDHLGVMKSDLFVAAKEAGILTEIYNVFYNCAWTFPAFTDEEALTAQSFVENGKNLFVAGQDIGWDIMSGQSGSHGTPVTQNFYTNFLKAAWVDDGSTANNLFIANSSDLIFGTVAQSGVVDVYGGNMYPDQINPLDNATATFYYNTAKTKTGAIRSMTGAAKVAYFGVGMEMIQNESVRNDILDKTYDWFMEGVGISDQNINNGGTITGIYPNPAKAFVSVKFSKLTSPASVSISDVYGRRLVTKTINANQNPVCLPVINLPEGMYIVTLENNGKVLSSCKLSISN